MVTCCDTGRASQSDLLPRADDGTITDAKTAQVHIYGFEAILMIHAPLCVSVFSGNLCAPQCIYCYGYQICYGLEVL